MAGSDSQKQLFTLIRGFATEKSQGGNNFNFYTLTHSKIIHCFSTILLAFFFSIKFSLQPNGSFFASGFAERRIVNLKKQIEELRSKLELANLELEGAKRVKEVTEQELKGYEVELSMNEATIQTLEVPFSYLSSHFD